MPCHERWSLLTTRGDVAGRTKSTEDASTSYHPGSTAAHLGPHSLADAAAKAAPAVVNVTLQGGNYGTVNVRPYLHALFLCRGRALPHLACIIFRSWTLVLDGLGHLSGEGQGKCSVSTWACQRSGSTLAVAIGA